MAFSDILRSLLESRGLKQADLCRMTGIDTGLMSTYMSGKKAPSLSNAILIASALNISLDELSEIRRSASEERSNQLRNELLMYFDSLNDEGKQTAVRMVQGLTSVDVYKKSYPVRVGNEKSA